MKKIYSNMPPYVKRGILRTYEVLCTYQMRYRMRGEMSTDTYKKTNVPQKTKPRLLFYQISALSFGGTEKFLQIVAKYVDKKKYDVFIMYSPKPRASSGNIPLDGRLSYLKDQGIEFIPFDYDRIGDSYPYELYSMNPSFTDVVKTLEVDLIITAGSGYADFPINTINNRPVIILNVFGSPCLQPNVVKHICISHEVADKISPIVSKDKIDVIYIQSENIDLSEDVSTDSLAYIYKHKGREIRARFGIQDTDVVFGRIGRPDDNIFDSIAINAFSRVVKECKEAHYIIMSPPPVLVELVQRENIQNVHFLPTSSEESDVWAFHFSLDALAHFRLDGESFGLNIAESMIAGNPILTHRSHIWNAHLEYLDPSFSYVANKDDVDGYEKNMCSLIEAKKDGTLNTIKKAARSKAENLFIIDNNIAHIEQIIDESLHVKN